jgi:hypothetical protein
MSDGHHPIDDVPKHVRAAVKLFAGGVLDRSVKDQSLDAFWSRGWLVIVQLDPTCFPAMVTRAERARIERERMRDGTPKHVLALHLRSIEGGYEVVRVKNFPDM